MAVYFDMYKIKDDSDCVEYQFGRSDGAYGIVKLDKVRETIKIMKPCPDDSRGAWGERACMKLARLWSKKEFPEKTEWAS